MATIGRDGEECTTALHAPRTAPAAWLKIDWQMLLSHTGRRPRRIIIRSGANRCAGMRCELATVETMTFGHAERQGCGHIEGQIRAHGASERNQAVDLARRIQIECQTHGALRHLCHRRIFIAEGRDVLDAAAAARATSRFDRCGLNGGAPKTPTSMISLARPAAQGSLE